MTLGIVILTGAGISAESGLSTFRGAEGMWEGHRVAEVATPEGFAANPPVVQRFYNGLRRRLADVEPSVAHSALAMLRASRNGSGTGTRPISASTVVLKK